MNEDEAHRNRLPVAARKFLDDTVTLIGMLCGHDSRSPVKLTVKWKLSDGSTGVAEESYPVPKREDAV